MSQLVDDPNLILRSERLREFQGILCGKRNFAVRLSEDLITQLDAFYQ